ncbi:spore germination protein GerPB [Bacillus testis]|uniref:spore germination protein GerPB n=1 Tax=Bacillus testis TaxID=1622072 RepID=UPI00067F6218|nr:spore germination protein GerPB [Bacillus testis]
MNYYITQTIQIHSIRIGSITNSSIFQIGSAGIIKSLSTLSNTGQFTEEAPALPSDGAVTKRSEQ